MILVKDGLALYAGSLKLTDKALFGKGFVDRRLNTSNSTLIDVPTPEDFIGRGYNWDGSTLAITPEYESELIEKKKAELKVNANLFRKEKVNAGMTVSGVSIDTDSESQAMMTSALIVLDKGSKGNVKFPSSVNWRTKNGAFVPLDFASLENIVAAVTAFVEGCFTAEAEHAAAIDLITTLDEANSYDYTAGWPSEVMS